MNKAIILAFSASSLILTGSLSYAQGLSISILPDTETLISDSAKPSLLESKQNLKTSLVDIRALDAQVIQTDSGAPRIGALESHGHGVIIDPSGIIVTNTHIILNAKHIYVTLADGQTFEASVLYNSDTDFSFIKIDVPYLLKAIALGDSSQLQTGNPVVAFAHSSTGLNGQAPVGGKVIQLIKDVDSQRVDFLELRLNLRPGDSGGPILDPQGCLLGLIMANQKTDNTKSYAIAVNRIQQEYLKFKGSVLVKANTL